MTAGKDFIYITQNDDKIFMWVDEPQQTHIGWIGKQPYVNSVVHEMICRAIGDVKLDGPEVIMLPQSQHDEMLPQSQHDEMLPQSQHDEMLPQSQHDEMLPQSQHDEMLPQSQHDEMLPQSNENEQK